MAKCLLPHQTLRLTRLQQVLSSLNFCKPFPVIDPPTTTNMIAMAALSGGSGSYNWGQVVDTYTTAYTAFRAAVIESELAVNNEKLGNVTPYDSCLPSLITTVML